MKLWGRFLSILVIALLAGGNASASAAPSVLSGKVTDDLNRPVANTSVTISRAGTTLGTVKTTSAGAYSFSVEPGAYSIKFVPPTTANSSLNAYDIVAPQNKALAVKLTKPMPGRAFLTGNLTTSPAMKLAADSTVYFGTQWATQVNSLGDYRLTPTAGTNDLFKIKAASLGDFSFGLFAQDKVSINQDTIANFVVPVVSQRVRVVNAAGAPIAGARVEAGQGSYGSDWGNFGVIEGLGSYFATWKNKAVTDSNGYITINTVKMATPGNAGFLVTPPAANKYLPQQFLKVSGAGDVTLVVTNQASLLSGTVRDQAGKGVGPIDIGFGDVWTTTNSQGVYAKPMADGTKGAYSMLYRSGSFIAGGTATYASINPAIGATTMVATGGRAQDFVLKFDTVKVKVVDSADVPVAKAHVQLTDSDGYSPRGRYTLIAGQLASIASTNANAPTDANGIATLRVLHFDSEISGVVTVTPAKGSPLSWKMERANIGAGTSITVVLSRPTVTVSGKVTLSDGTPAAPYAISFSDGKGGDQGTGTVDPVTGAYTMQVPSGMKGQFWLTCPQDLAAGLYPFCMSFVGGSRTITANTVVDIVIPTEKTELKIVDPAGKGIAGVNVQVWHSVGTGLCTAATTQIFSDYPTLGSAAFSIGTTDENGLVVLITVKMAAPCEANVQLAPEANSRYQSRSVKLTLGDDADNVFVLSIPSPVISSGTPGTAANGSRMITVVGENFLGTTGVTWNGEAIANFKVYDNYTIKFLLPTIAAATGEVVVTNGGGSARFSVQ